MRLRHVLASISLTAPLASCCLQEEHWREQSRSFVGPQPGRMGELLAACEATQDCEPVCLYDWSVNVAPADFENEVRDCEVTKDLRTNTTRVSYEGLEICVAGRRPAGYAHERCAAPTPTGAFLAEQAALEAASVRAFDDLRADLAMHRAPRALQRASVAAAADEVRHARVCARLARRHGGRVQHAAAASVRRRSLRELAIDNAVEGCVRETYGTVVAGYQARAAADPAIRTAMTTIARDEARHAQLAWRLQRWLAPRLSRAERAEATARARGAREELRASVGTPDRELARIVGLPDADAAHHMLDELERSVWRAA